MAEMKTIMERSVLLVAFCQLLKCPSNSSIRVEGLADYASRCKRTSYLLPDATNISILGELTSDGTVFAENRCSLAGLLSACTCLVILLAKGIKYNIVLVVLTVCWESS